MPHSRAPDVPVVIFRLILLAAVCSYSWSCHALVLSYEYPACLPARRSFELVLPARPYYQHLCGV